jgi:EAL domain-containing protein (putative c-di-GMP-specific phosphodiesterase class I)
LDLTVVAEGIESLAQLATVPSSRCDLAQGFHLSRPVSARDLERHVLASASDGDVVRLPLSV